MGEPLFMDKAAFGKQLEEETEWIERNIKGFLPKDVTLQKTIYKAMEYSIMAGGKGCALCLCGKHIRCLAEMMKMLYFLLWLL